MNILSSTTLWLGQYLNYFARCAGRDYERVSRPLKWGTPGFEATCGQEVAERRTRSYRLGITFPLALVATPLSLIPYSLAYLFSPSRLEIHDEQAPILPATRGRTLRLLSLNVCFQEGWGAPCAGGVVPPFDPIGGHPSRIAALAHWVAAKNPDVFMGQEVSDLSAQNAFVDELKKRGFRFFIIDRAPHPLYHNSGLLIASKYKLSQIAFHPFPVEDRSRAGRYVQKGALACSIADKNGTVLRLMNTHLDWDEGQLAKQVRLRQFKKYVLPPLRDSKIPTILMGDLNFDTSEREAKREAGLEGFTNLCEGRVTWTNEGIVHLRDGTRPHLTENIDAIIPNSDKVQVTDVTTEKVTAQGALLTDHYAVAARVRRSFTVLQSPSSGKQMSIHAS